MANKELIEEVTVSDRTSSMTNPKTNDSFKTAEAVGEGCLEGSCSSVVIAPVKRRRYSTQKMELPLPCFSDDALSISKAV